MQGVDSFIQARHFKRGHTSRQLWVIHDEEYPERPDSAERVGQYFASVTRPASAHACVDNNSIVGCVDWKDTAYHAGASSANARSIGIEHSGYAHQTRAEWLDMYGLDMLDRSARLYADVGYSTFRILPYHLTLTQIRAICYGTDTTTTGICSHGDITRALSIRGGHTDPGPNFPWDWFLARCQHYTLTPLPPKDDDMGYADWSKTDKEAFIADIRKALLYPLTGSQPVHPEKDDEWMNLSKLANQIANK